MLLFSGRGCLFWREWRIRPPDINADILSDEELTAVSDMLDSAEKKMNEKLMEEIDRRRSGMVKNSSGLWVPVDADTPRS